MSTPYTYQAKLAAAAAQFNPSEPIGRAEFMERASAYSLPVLRLASARRYIVARGRSYAQVLSRFADIVANPNVNRGDTYADALGHIEAAQRFQWEMEHPAECGCVLPEQSCSVCRQRGDDIPF